MTISETPDFLTITCDTEYKIAELQWDKYTDFPSFQEIYRQLAQYMETNELNCALIDVSRRGEVSYAAKLWLSCEFYPAMIAQTNKTLKLAYVLSPEHFSTLQSEALHGDMETHSTLLKMRFFLDASIACHWLTIV